MTDVGTYKGITEYKDLESGYRYLVDITTEYDGIVVRDADDENGFQLWYPDMRLFLKDWNFEASECEKRSKNDKGLIGTEEAFRKMGYYKINSSDLLKNYVSVREVSEN